MAHQHRTRAQLRLWLRTRIEENPDGCWLWTGNIDREGYGLCKVVLDGQRTTRAHRAAYMILCGPVPEGTVTDHLCRVRRCVNPDHLEMVTAEENTQRAIPARGEAHGRTRLTGSEVLRIRRLSQSMSQAAISRQLGLSTTTVNNLVTRRTWSHL